MLDPDDRTLLLDALRPPDGFDLDQAVATTFTLDLDALLVAPLAFALYDWITDEEGRPDPLAILESLRRYAHRTTVFCQAGEVGFRAAYRPLVVLVEGSVVPVAAPAPDFVFHPKLWVLRFTDGVGGVRHRLLVASRNLTFDRSWDTLLRLDGEPARGPVAASAPIAELVRRLPDLATAPMAATRADAVRALADELASVWFAPPDGFDGLAFHPIGLTGAGDDWPLRARYDRALVVSPYLSGGTLGRLAAAGNGHVLVSSPEALDGVGRAAVDGYAATYVLNAAALPGGEASLDDGGDVAVGAGRPELDGLHAKLFLLERGDRVSVYTGSANATEAAFDGNVELLVELTGARDLHGVAALLEPGKGTPTFRTLLQEHQAPTGEPEPPTDEEAAQHELDRLRRAIAGLAFTMRLRPEGEDYLARIEAAGAIPGGLEALSSLEAWPITRAAGHAIPLARDADRLVAEYGRLSQDGISGFLAVRATLARGSVEVSTTFVVPAALVGAPGGRAERVLVSMLRNREDLLRYLLFLLADADTDLDVLLDAFGARDPGGGDRFERAAPPLLETMLKTLASDPARLDHVASLLADLRRDERGEELVPASLDEVWAPIWAVREELRR